MAADDEVVNDWSWYFTTVIACGNNSSNGDDDDDDDNDIIHFRLFIIIFHQWLSSFIRPCLNYTAS